MKLNGPKGSREPGASGLLKEVMQRLLTPATYEAARPDTPISAGLRDQVHIDMLYRSAGRAAQPRTALDNEGGRLDSYVGALQIDKNAPSRELTLQCFVLVRTIGNGRGATRVLLCYIPGQRGRK